MSVSDFQITDDITLPDGTKAFVSTVNGTLEAQGLQYTAETMIFKYKEQGSLDMSGWGEKRHSNPGETPPRDSWLRWRHDQICADPQSISYHEAA